MKSRIQINIGVKLHGLDPNGDQFKSLQRESDPNQNES
jgi:hypothetical protein